MSSATRFHLASGRGYTTTMPHTRRLPAHCALQHALNTSNVKDMFQIHRQQHPRQLIAPSCPRRRSVRASQQMEYNLGALSIKHGFCQEQVRCLDALGGDYLQYTACGDATMTDFHLPTIASTAPVVTFRVSTTRHLNQVHGSWTMLRATEPWPTCPPRSPCSSLTSALSYWLVEAVFLPLGVSSEKLNGRDIATTDLFNTLQPDLRWEYSVFRVELEVS
jgi:hypothetical protein